MHHLKNVEVVNIFLSCHFSSENITIYEVHVGWHDDVQYFSLPYCVSLKG